jgi:DnaJ-class molecular chaperone
MNDEPLNPGDDAAPGTFGTGENICPKCNGTGRIEDGDCANCGGTGKVVEGLAGG